MLPFVDTKEEKGYDANQLKKAKWCSGSQTIAEYVYDGSGNRMVKKHYNYGTLMHTVYSWSDLFETKVYASGGSAQSTSYYFINNELVSKKDNAGARTYFHNDHLGSTTVVTNQAGTLVESTKYDPWGEVNVGGTVSKFQYTGQERDTETGLNYYNFRYYDPHIRRFTQPDDVIQNVYDPQTLNRYAYVRNNPLRYTDPTGHFFSAAVRIITAGLAAYGMYNILYNNVPAVKEGQKILVNNFVNNVSTTYNAVKTEVKRGTEAASQGINNAAQGAMNNWQNFHKQSNDALGNHGGKNDAGRKAQINFRSEERLLDHYQRHGGKLGKASVDEYLKGARELFKGGDGVEALQRGTDELYYRPATNEFGIIDRNGIIRTYMSPRNGYWDEQLIKFVK